MHLINTSSLKLEYFPSLNSAPIYAILSHTWGDEEVTFGELGTPEALHKSGYQKICQACSLALRDGFRYAWIDTCCIDKKSSAELSEAINSMFRWYQASAVCYVFLEDVADVSEINGARWFTRGWTLQELLAPLKLVVLNKCWQPLGDRKALAPAIADATNISVEVLQGPLTIEHIRGMSIAQRMSWASKRNTTREEDIAYCLLGLFQVNMPLLYGEGSGNAFRRLQEEIMKHSADQTILAWSVPPGSELSGRSGPLADHPSHFSHSSSVVSAGDPFHFLTTNKGIRIRMPIFQSGKARNQYVGVLSCIHESRFTCFIGIPLIAVQRDAEAFIRSSGPLAEVPPSKAHRAHIREVFLLQDHPGTFCTTPGEPKAPSAPAGLPAFLWARNIPAVMDFGTGPCPVEVALIASIGSWDLINRTVKLQPAELRQDVLMPRLYTIKLTNSQGLSLDVIVKLPKDGHSYTAEVRIVSGLRTNGSPKDLLNSSTSSSGGRHCLNKLDDGDTISATLSWQLMFSREILVLDVSALEPTSRGLIIRRLGRLTSGIDWVLVALGSYLLLHLGAILLILREFPSDYVIRTLQLSENPILRSLLLMGLPAFFGYRFTANVKQILIATIMCLFCGAIQIAVILLDFLATPATERQAIPVRMDKARAFQVAWIPFSAVAILLVLKYILPQL